MLPADCGPETLTAHGSYYEDPVYDWIFQCGDLVDQQGALRVSAVLPTEKVGCQEAQGPTCTPCRPDQQPCGRLETGLSSGFIYVRGDRPAGMSYRLRCGDPPPPPALIFYLALDGAQITCQTDPYGQTTCDRPGCSLIVTRADTAVGAEVLPGEGQK